MTKEVALAGNPNSGKTTLFNALTGSSQVVGNWPGVTVEKKEGRLKNHPQILIQDLPGIYSLSPYSSEEVISRKFLIDRQPDMILDTVDATNLERNLYLTLQLMEIGRPLIIALNMTDLLERMGRRINTDKLSYLLGVKIFSVSALKGTGIRRVSAALTEKSERFAYQFPRYDNRIESALKMIQENISGVVPADLLRWYSIKIYERDEKVMAAIKPKLDQQVSADIEDIIATSEKILGDQSDSVIANARYDLITRIVQMCVADRQDVGQSLTERIDKVVANKWLAFPIFAVVMWFIYYVSIQLIGSWGSDWLNDVLFGRIILHYANGLLSAWNVASWMKGLIVDGIIGGVGAVIGFLPQIVMLFFCLGLLEDCGYMARIAFVMDRVFHKFNLSGRSFIPMIVSTACGVPGVMATRTIENEKDRKMTIMITTFMPCSAKLTIITLIGAAFFPHQSWVAPSAYLLSIAVVVGSGIFLKKTKLFAGESAPFVMELPAYHLPRMGNVLRQVWSRSKGFVKKAGTIIFASCVLIWFLANFNAHLQMVPEDQSLLRNIGGLVAPLFKPLGFDDWRAAVAVLTGLIAKENCVGTLKIMFGSHNSAAFMADLRQTFLPVVGYTFLAFNVLCAPCFAAIGAMYREYGDTRWTLRAVLYQTIVAYILGTLIYQGYQLFNGQFSLVNLVLFILALGIIIYGLFIKQEKIGKIQRV